MSKLIVVVGATGNQGGSVIKTFSKLNEWKVRGITRNPEGDSAQVLRNNGVEVVAGDLDSRESLVKAFSGATAIFGVTDFWQFAKDKKTFAEAKERKLLPNVICLERELEQFKNIVDAAAQVLAAENKLERLVLSTLSYTTKISQGTIKNNLHFDGKAMGVEYLQASTNLELVDLRGRTSYVQIGHYLDNWSKGLLLGPKQLEDGSFVYTSNEPPSSNSTIPWVHPPTDTGPFVEALVLKNPPRTTMLGTSQELTISEYAHLLSQHFGSPFKVRYLSREKAVEVMGEAFGNEITDSGEYVAKYGWDGGVAGVKRPWEAGVDMAALTKPDQYIRQTDWSSILVNGTEQVQP